MIKIGIAADHAGVVLKEKIKDFLKLNYDLEDYGTNSEESVDYPDFAHPLANSIADKYNEFGIIICGSGNGVCMTVNKHKDVRGALCWNKEIASLARKHNNANILCLPARFITEEIAIEIVNEFLVTNFEGGRHQKRVDKIAP